MATVNRQHRTDGGCPLQANQGTTHMNPASRQKYGRVEFKNFKEQDPRVDTRENTQCA